MEISEINPADLTALQAQGYTENDLSMLAPTEVAALLAVPTDNDGNHADHDAAQAEQEAAILSDADKAAAAATAAVNAAAAVTAEPAAAEAAPFVPQYRVDVPADAKEQITALKNEDSDAFKKLMDGEIDADEYKVVKDRTEAAIDELKTKALTASIFEQANQQTAEQNAKNEWSKAETAAFTGFKGEGLDYKAKPALLAAYNTNLQALGADPKNEKRDAPWFLAEAHRLTKEDLGFVSVRKNVPATRTNGVDPTEMPPTLRSVPIAATGAIGSDEFAHMRNLDGLALERAHAKLTNEQRDRWMAE